MSVALVVVLGSCGGSGAEEPTTTSPAMFPTGVVRVWLDAVASGDLGRIASSVDETSAVIVIAAENDYSVGELASLLEGGLSGGVASTYWGSFEDSFREFRGISLSSIVVGDFEMLDVDDGEYAAVRLMTSEGATDVVTRRGEDGQWRIDMVATFGPALVRLLRAVLDEAADDPIGALVRSGFSRAVLPGLAAAIELDREDTLLQSQLGAMRVLVGDR